MWLSGGPILGSVPSTARKTNKSIFESHASKQTEDTWLSFPAQNNRQATPGGTENTRNRKHANCLTATRGRSRGLNESQGSRFCPSRLGASLCSKLAEHILSETGSLLQSLCVGPQTLSVHAFSTELPTIEVNGAFSHLSLSLCNGSLFFSLVDPRAEF